MVIAFVIKICKNQFLERKMLKYLTSSYNEAKMSTEENKQQKS